MPEINQAFIVANQANFTKEEIENLEARKIYIHGQKNAIKRAKNQAIEEGKEIGKQIGIRETQIEIAKKLLEFLDAETVSKNTALSLEEVERLRKQ